MGVSRLIFCCLWGFSCFCAKGGEPLPNIVLINADDLGWAELGCYGQEKIKTPHLDNLAAQGQRWSQFYSGAPTCSPSRNVLMTGRHSGSTDVRDLKRQNPRERVDFLEGDMPIQEKTYTLPKALKTKGYATALCGKWGLGEFGTSGDPMKQGFDFFYGYTDQRMCHTFYPTFLWNQGKKEWINEKTYPWIAPGHFVQKTGEVKAESYAGKNHASPLILAKAREFVEKMAQDKKPFFLYYAPLEPHVALQPLAEWVEKYPLSWDKKPYRGEQGYLPHPRPRAAYAAMISQLDAQVGALMQSLKEAGVERNTLVIFTSDNGTTHDVGGVDHRFFNSTKNLRGLKGQVYEGGIRVPGIIWWPQKIKASQVIDQPAYHADILPTLCALVGASAGESNGEDLSPILLGEKQSLPQRKPMIWGGGAYHGQIAVRLGEIKALRRKLFPHEKANLDWEVYDLAQDSGETQNKASQCPDLLEKVIQILEREYQKAEGFEPLLYKRGLTSSLK